MKNEITSRIYFNHNFRLSLRKNNKMLQVRIIVKYQVLMYIWAKLFRNENDRNQNCSTRVCKYC